ncbi:MAG: exosortase C-terminal domain/associated protein EpsI [Pseudomonadota bacterium]
MSTTGRPEHAHEASPQQQWRGPLVLLAILLVTGIAFAPTVTWVAGQWSAGGVVGHGYLVAAISLWLLWRERQWLLSGGLAAGWWALPLVGVLSLAWLVGYVANVIALQTVVIPLIALLAIIVALGPRVGALVGFPLLYLYCALPALRLLRPVFQTITTEAVGVLLTLADVPAYLDGNFVILAAGSFEIAEGCSGVSYLLAGVSVALLYGYLYYDTIGRSLLLLLAAMLAAMIGNWIRVAIIIAIGHFGGMDHPLVADHLSLGWVIFAIMLVPVMVIARRLEPLVVTPRVLPAPRGRFQPVAAVAALVALVAGPVWAAVVSPAEHAARVTIELPQVSGWQGPRTYTGAWSPRFVGPTDQIHGEYRSAEGVVSVYANVYVSQQQGQELIFFSNDIAGDWERDRPRRAEPVVGTVAGPFRELVARSIYGETVIWYRYAIGESVSTADRDAKWQQALAVLRGTPGAGAVAMASRCEPDCDAARARLRGLMAAWDGQVVLRTKDPSEEGSD